MKQPLWIPVHPWFHSPWSSTCVLCRCELVERKSAYMIERITRWRPDGKEEGAIAICMDCLRVLDGLMSFPSRGLRDHWIRRHIRLDDRLERWKKSEPAGVVSRLHRCAVSGEDVISMARFHSVALCRGDKMLLGGYPYTVSGDAVDELRSLMSKETLEMHAKFAKRILDDPSDEPWSGLLRNECVAPIPDAPAAAPEPRKKNLTAVQRLVRSVLGL